MFFITDLIHIASSQDLAHVLRDGHGLCVAWMENFNSLHLELKHYVLQEVAHPQMTYTCTSWKTLRAKVRGHWQLQVIQPCFPLLNSECLRAHQRFTGTKGREDGRVCVWRCWTSEIRHLVFALLPFFSPHF